MVCDITETFSTMMLGIEVSTLYVVSFVHNLRYFLEMKFTKSSDQDANRSKLVSDSIY